jgi:hypothetical protein
MNPRKSPISLPKECFTPHTRSLKLSASWRSMTQHEHRILDRLEIENECHAGRENGNLAVSWRQFAEYGVAQKFISPGIDRLAKIGLLEITSPGTAGHGPAHCSRYRLTYLPAKTIDENGNVSYPEPTHEWRTAPDVPQLQRRDPQRRGRLYRKKVPKPNGAHPEVDPFGRNI